MIPGQQIRQDIFDIVGEKAPCAINVTTLPIASIDVGTLQIIETSCHHYVLRVDSDSWVLGSNIYQSRAITIQGIDAFNEFIAKNKPSIIHFVIAEENRILHGPGLDRIRFHYQ